MVALPKCSCGALEALVADARGGLYMVLKKNTHITTNVIHHKFAPQSYPSGRKS